MNEKCPQCGAPRSPNDAVCKYCGEKLPIAQSSSNENHSSKTTSSNGQPVVIINNGSTHKPQPSTVQPIQISNTYVYGKKKKRWLPIVIIVIIIIAVIISVITKG